MSQHSIERWPRRRSDGVSIAQNMDGKWLVWDDNGQFVLLSTEQLDWLANVATTEDDDA